MNNKTFPLKELANAFKGAFPVVLDAMGNDAVNFILDNFRKQGFQGATFNKWAKRKNDKYSKGRAILVKSSRLRRSWHATKDVGSLTAKAVTDVLYAKVHNEGGEIKHAERQQVLHFRKTKNQTRFSKVKNAKFAQKVNVGAHVTIMPQRQMIGNSPVLTKKVRQTVEAQFSKVLQGFKTT